MSDDIPWETQHPFFPGGVDRVLDLPPEEVCIVCGMSTEHECHFQPDGVEEQLKILRDLHADVRQAAKNIKTDWALGQLRHLYQQMLDGQVTDVRTAATGLLGPAIEGLEQDLSDTGCSMSGRYDLGHGIDGLCAIRRDHTCPPACIAKSLRSREAQVRGQEIEAKVLHRMFEEMQAWRVLFVKYIRLIGHEEGITYIHDDIPFFTKDEIAQLRVVEEEAKELAVSDGG